MLGFLSYSRQDSTSAERLVGRLTAAGHRIWIDREGIHGGELWRLQIVKAIESAEAFFLALTPSSVQSDNVRKEVDIAEDAKVRIFPVEVAATTIPQSLKYHLAGLQRLDLTTDYEAGIRQLLSALGDRPGAPKKKAAFTEWHYSPEGQRALAAINDRAVAATETLVLEKVAKYWNQQSMLDRPDGLLYVTSHRLVFVSTLKTLTTRTDVLSIPLSRIEKLESTRVMFVSPAIRFTAEGKPFMFTFFKNAEEVVQAIQSARRS